MFLFALAALLLFAACVGARTNSSKSGATGDHRNFTDGIGRAVSIADA